MLLRRSIAIGVCIAALLAAVTVCIQDIRRDSPTDPLPSVELRSLQDDSPPVAEQGDGDLVTRVSVADFGLIRQSIEHTITYRNRGRSPVKITGIRPSCNCTVTEADRTLLNPGETGSITVRVDPLRQQTGRHVQVIDVDYRGDVAGSLRFELRFQNWPDVVIPEQIDLRVVTAGTATKQFEIFDYRDRPLRIMRISTSSPDLSARLIAEPTGFLPGWRYLFDVVASAGTVPSERIESIHVHTDDPIRAEIRIRVSLRQVHRVRLAPSTLHLTRDEAGREVGRLVVIDSLGDAVEIESVKPSCESLTYEDQSGPGKRGRFISLRLDCRAKSTMTPIRVSVTVRKPVREELMAEVFPCDP